MGIEETPEALTACEPFLLFAELCCAEAGTLKLAVNTAAETKEQR